MSTVSTAARMGLAALVSWVAVAASAQGPAITYVSGMGPHPLGTAKVQLVIATAAPARCRLATTAGNPYGSLYWNFSSADGRTHSTTVDTYGATSTQTYYARCQDSATRVANDSDFPLAIRFGQAASYAMNVSVAGAGKVVSSPAAIDCGSACSASFSAGQNVSLTAVPSAGAAFTGWGGACAGSAPTCTVAMSAARSVSAAFSTAPPAGPLLSVVVAGPGSVTSAPAGIQCGTSCAATFATGQTVTLTATARDGGSFIGWGGACTGAAPSCSVPMTAAASVTASFAAAPGTSQAYPWPVWTADPVAVPPSATGLTYYVDGRFGRDTNSGTSVGAAFATVRQAITRVAPGDTVLIRAGLYREGINLNNAPSGAPGKPITFGSYGDGEVILDGSAKVSGWTQVSASVWKAPVGFTPVAVVVNEVPLKQTYDGAAAVTAGSGRWFYNATAKTITADFGAANPATADVVVPNNVGDQAHVFFYGSHYTFKGLTIRGSGSNGIWGYGSHVTVERCNIKFNGKAGVAFQGAGDSDNAVLYSHIFHNVLQNWPRGNNGNAEAGGGWPGATVWAANLRPLARGNVVHMNGGEGIASYGTVAGKASGSALFEQNVVYDNWSVNMYFDNQPNGVARNNIIFNHPVDTGTWLKTTNAWPWNELYKYNVCVMLGDEQNSSDATGNYANLANVQVYNNLIAGCRIGIRDYGEGATTVKYHGLRNTLIANNTIILPASALPNTETMGIFLQDNTTPGGTNRNANSFIQNNVIVGSGVGTPLVWIENTKALSGITVSNNVYFNRGDAAPFRIGFDDVQNLDFAGWLARTGADLASLYRDPLLLDAAAFQVPGTAVYDYRKADLGATSPARGMGRPQSAFSNNLPGTVRPVWNAGAF